MNKEIIQIVVVGIIGLLVLTGVVAIYKADKLETIIVTKTVTVEPELGVYPRRYTSQFFFY